MWVMDHPQHEPPPPVEHALQAINDATTWLDMREPTDPLDRIERWQAAAAVLDGLSTVVGQMAADAVNAMLELGREALETSIGPVYTEPGYAREEWDGNALLGTLSKQLVDRTSGEIVDAVPTDVLRSIIPGVGVGKTSSKWGVTGLRKLGVRVDTYRRKEPAPTVIRRGVPRR